MKKEGNKKVRRVTKVAIGQPRYSEEKHAKKARIIIRGQKLSGDFEETKDKTFLVTIARSAAFNAINENKALGIPTTYLHGNKVIIKQADGIERTVRELSVIGQRKFIKGTVLHVRKATRS